MEVKNVKPGQRSPFGQRIKTGMQTAKAALLRVLRRFKERDELEKMRSVKNKKLKRDEDTKDGERLERDKIRFGKQEYHERQLERRRVKELAGFAERIRTRFGEGCKPLFLS